MNTCLHCFQGILLFIIFRPKNRRTPFVITGLCCGGEGISFSGRSLQEVAFPLIPSYIVDIDIELKV